jgi:hypothetical protein
VRELTSKDLIAFSLKNCHSGVVADLRRKPWSFSKGKEERPAKESFVRLPPTGTPRPPVSGERTPVQRPTGYPPKPGGRLGDTKPPPGPKSHVGSTRGGTSRMGENALLALIGPLDQVPSLVVELAGLTDLRVDHRAGFLLSQVDGNLTLETIIDISGMRKVEALRLIYTLVEDGILTLA